MKHAWKDWVYTWYRTKPRLTSALLAAKVKHYCDRIQVNIPVHNDAQRKWIEEKIVPEIQREYSEYCCGRPVSVTVQIVERN